MTDWPEPDPKFHPGSFRAPFEAVTTDPTVSGLLEKLQRDLLAEDTRMRSEVLPPAPEGWVWVSEFVRNDDIRSREVVVFIRYHLRMENDRW